MNYLAGRMVGLDGVIAQVANYQKSGFQLTHYSKRYQGEATGETLTDARIVELADLPFEELKSYDEAVFSFPRSDFLHQWIKMPESIALGIKEDNQLAGYAVLRKCYEGYKVGPLFADNAELAETLFKVITSRIPKGTPVFLDIPDDTVNPEATLLVKRYHMQEVFQTARMYSPVDPSTEIKLPLHKWYGITSFELG